MTPELEDTLGDSQGDLMTTDDLGTIEPIASLEEPQLIIEDNSPATKSKRILDRTAWTVFGIFCVLVFTFIKLPEDRIQNFINGNISSFLAQKDISFSAKESKLSYFLGISYTLKGVTLNFPPPAPPAQIEWIRVSPSFLSLLIGRIGGSVEIENAKGSLNGSFSMRKSKLSLSYKAKNFNLGKAGILAPLSGIHLSAIINGSGSVSGDFEVPSSLDGGITLQLSKVELEPQVIQGFSIPKISISEGVADLEFDKGKAIIKSFRLGKPGSTAGTDDLSGTVAGDLTLMKRWEASILNLRTRFSISESVLKSFVLLDAILGSGKQPDKSYGFLLSGPLENPNSSPLTGDK